MSDAAIERFFQTYAERYMASDIDAVAGLYEVPLLAVREGRPIHLHDQKAVREHLTGLMEAYRSAGAKQATIADLRVVQLDGASVIATCPVAAPALHVFGYDVEYEGPPRRCRRRPWLTTGPSTPSTTVFPMDAGRLASFGWRAAKWRGAPF